METSPTPPRSRQPLKLVLTVLIALVAVFVILRIGMFVGYQRAEYSFHWGDEYHQMFGGPPQGFLDDFNGHGFVDAHGLFGDVLGVRGNEIMMRDKDGTEKIVVISPETVIRRQMNNLPVEKITPQMRIVIIGEPEDDGRIEAKMIRVFDQQLTHPPVMRAPGIMR
jgi:hypothetical protein